MKTLNFLLIVSILSSSVISIEAFQINKTRKYIPYVILAVGAGYLVYKLFYKSEEINNSTDNSSKDSSNTRPNTNEHEHCDGHICSLRSPSGKNLASFNANEQSTSAVVHVNTANIDNTFSSNESLNHPLISSPVSIDSESDSRSESIEDHSETQTLGAIKFNEFNTSGCRNKSSKNKRRKNQDKRRAHRQARVTNS